MDFTVLCIVAHKQLSSIWFCALGVLYCDYFHFVFCLLLATVNRKIRCESHKRSHSERLTQEMPQNWFSCLAVPVTNVSARYTTSVADYAFLLWIVWARTSEYCPDTMDNSGAALNKLFLVIPQNDLYL